MRKPSFFILIVLFCTSSSFANETVSNELFIIQETYLDTIPAKKSDTSYIDENGQVKIFEKVEVEAEFPGGLTAWRDFIVNNLRPDVPVTKGAPAGQYNVIVQFIVDKAGAITGIKALTNYGYGMESEVIRMIKRSPKWIPAQQEGRFVNAYRQQPITFVVQEEKKKRRSRD
jgi:periplasmic protein TonB